MNIDLIKTSDTEGALHVKYTPYHSSSEYSVTLPFSIKEDGMVEFRISQEALGDLVNLIEEHFQMNEKP